MSLLNLDEFLRQNCVDRMEGKSCDECKHHVLEVSCERLMEQPTAEVTLCHLDSPCEYQNADIAMPSAQPERKKGKWKYETMRHIITGEMRTVRICSVCDGGWFRYDMSDGVEEAEPNFCPNCGADMRGEGDETD